MNEVRYTIQDRDQLPEGLDWLTPGEQARYEGFRFDKRRGDWLLGRWAAKRALLELAERPDRDMTRFEIRSEENGAPLPMLDGAPYEVGLSISHSNDRAFCVVSAAAPMLGCDIEFVEPRSGAFVETFFTAAEHGCVECADPRDRDTLVTMIWSAKESTLKALRTGLRSDTRSVEVVSNSGAWDGGWASARTIAAAGGEFSCLWRLEGQWLMSIVTREPAVVRVLTK